MNPRTVLRRSTVARTPAPLPNATRSFPPRANRLPPLAPLALALTIAGCDALGDRPSSADVGLSPPMPLLQSRAVVADALRPVVTVDGNVEIPMVPNGDGSRWRGSVDVPPNRDYTLSIVWIEQGVVSGERTRDLPLARLDRTVSVDADGTEFFLESADRYRYEPDGEAYAELDADGDGIGNFAERDSGSDPFPPISPPATPRDDSSGVPVPPIPEGDPAEPAEPVEPARPDEIREPDEPAELEQPDEPAQPDEPNEPARPDESEEVVQPDEPDEPAQPDEPEEAAQPDEPDEPAQPDEPARPDEPNEPARPDEPAQPDEPEEPARPDEPAQPDEPDEPARPDEPAQPDEPDPVSPPVTVDLVIPRIARSDAPKLDGLGVSFAGDGFGGEWASATTVDASGKRLFIDRLMVDQGTDESDGQAFRAWGAMHDGRFLYVLVVVEDDGFRVRDDAPELLWQDDSLEVYVDGDNSKNTEYGDGNDSSRILPLLAPGTRRTGTRDGIVSGYLSTDAPIRIDFATGPGVGPDGLRRPRYEQDVYELRIELESAGIEVGRPFGFELQVNDDDDGGAREAKWGWAHPSRQGGTDTDLTYENPSIMGTALLE